MKWVAALGLPLLAAVLWGVFATPGDPSRSGQTVVVTPGALRLGLEIVLFALAVGALGHTGARGAAVVLALLVLGHYAASYDRIAWLLRH